MHTEYIVIVIVVFLIAGGIWWKFDRKCTVFYVIGVVSLTCTVFALITFNDYVRKSNNSRQQVENMSSEPRLVTEDNFFVFVGELESVEKVKNTHNEDAIVHNYQFDLTFNILKPIWGNYDKQQISFTLYDHYGKPTLAVRKFSLIFVAKSEGQWIHEKYQWYPLNRTATGDWAYCGDPTPDDWKGQPAELSDIEFSPPVIKPVYQYTEEYIESAYPSKIWERHAEIVSCKTGVYPDELFRLKAEGVLKSRGLFR